jgi:dihydropyrimidinase
MDLVIRGGTLVTAAETFPADVGIDGGRIVTLGHGLHARQEIDAGGHLVMPGFVDAHVHLDMTVGELTTADDFASGTRAAACGGTTCLVDFVDPQPGEPLHQAVARRRAQADGQVCVDYSLHLTAIDARQQTLDELPALARAGYTSLKLYTTYPALMVSDAEMLALMEAAAACGILPMVHCENHAAIEYLKRCLQSGGQTGPAAHPRTRPPRVESEAVGRVLALAALAGAPVYVAHLSTCGALAALDAARAAGQPAWAEVCVQHLLLTDAEFERPGFESARFICSPPLRAAGHPPALWRALAGGRLAAASTDHCPWTGDQRLRGEDDFTQIPSGLPGVETRLPLLYHFGVRQGRLSLNRLVEVGSTAPARLFGLYPRKGSLAVGADADLVVFDPQAERTLSAASLHHRTDECPYEGWTVRGYPVTVLSRGQFVVRDGAFVGQPGAGQFVARHPGAAYAGPRPG